MTNNRCVSFVPSPKRRAATFALALMTLAASSACQSDQNTAHEEARGVVVVNSPAAGEVRRVLAREGMIINEGTTIIEIVVHNETPAPATGESSEARAVRNFKAADAEIEAARSEAVRHEAEVQRLTPLVASGEGSQAQLDGERSLYERAQQRLRRALDAKRNAETGLLATRQPEQNQGNSAALAPSAQIVAARASSSGTVSAITVRVGERVKAGQPLATLRRE